MKQHLFARRDGLRSLVREHFHIQVDALGIEREHRCLHANRSPFLDLVQIVDVRLECEQRAASCGAAGVVQTTAANQLISQNGFYDPYFRAYDQTYPDLWRFNEWNREFQQFVANGNLPTLEMIRGLSHDHTGNFGSALGGVNTPELQQADNDYAVGLLVQQVDPGRVVQADPGIALDERLV